MIGLIAIVVVVVLLVVAGSVFGYAFFWAQKKGKSTAASFLLAACAVFVLSLPITWDAIPTWIAFKYYSDKEAGLVIYKTLEQWKLENPGVAVTLVPYGLKDTKAEVKKLGKDTFRNPINERFAYDSSKTKLFLSVTAHRLEFIDIKNEEILAKYVIVQSGNTGGLASGGSGWWAVWLIHSSANNAVNFFNIVDSFKQTGATK